MLGALRGAFRGRAGRIGAAVASSAGAFGAYAYAESKSKPIGELKVIDDSTTKLDLEIQQRFLALDQGESVMAEYVWIGVRARLAPPPASAPAWAAPRAPTTLSQVHISAVPR